MFKKIVSLMLVVCVMLAVCITASAAGVEPATPPAGETSPITIKSATCVGRTVTVEYVVDASKNFDESKDVTVLFYSPVGPEGEEKYITYNNGETEQSAIYYADQVKYNNTNTLVFSLPGSVKEGTNYNVLVGGTDIDYPGLYEGVEVPAAFMYGDIDEDKNITMNDAMTAAQYSVRMAAARALIDGNPSLFSAADVDGDKNVTMNDAMTMAQYSVRMAAARDLLDTLNGKK